MRSINDALWKFKKYKKNIKEFKVIKCIGNGGFAVVNLVEHTKTKEKYAAKTILSDKISKKQIYREIEIMSRFQTSTFLKFYGFSLTDFENRNNITLFMEYIENRSLNYLLQDEKFSLAPTDYDNTTRQIIAIGIAYSMLILNQNLIIHRDLSPGNIFIDSNLHPKLGDFGLSKQIEIGNELFQSKSCGTLIYKSPENDKNMQYGMKNDVYSFGLILSEIFTGEFPYPEINNKSFQYEKFIEQIKEKKYEPKLKNFFKKSIQELILNCLSIDPNERPSFEEIFYKLAYNFDDENEDDNYFLPGVDAERISEYVESITNETTEINSNNINIIINDIIRHENVQKQKIMLFEQQIININQQLQKINKANRQILKLAIDNKNKIEDLYIGLTDNKKEINDISSIQIELISKVNKNIDELKNIGDKCKSMNEQIKEQSKKEDENIKQLNEKIESNGKKQAEDIKQLNNNIDKLKNELKQEIVPIQQRTVIFDDSLNKLAQKIKDNENEIKSLLNEQSNNIEKHSNYDESFKLIKYEIENFKLDVVDKVNNINKQIKEQTKKENDDVKQLNEKIYDFEKKQIYDLKQADNNKRLKEKLKKDIDTMKNEHKHEFAPIQKRNDNLHVSFDKNIFNKENKMHDQKTTKIKYGEGFDIRNIYIPKRINYRLYGIYDYSTGYDSYEKLIPFNNTEKENDKLDLIRYFHQMHNLKINRSEPQVKNDSQNIIEKTEEKQKNKPILRKKKAKNNNGITKT